MLIVGILEAGAWLSRLVDRVALGGEVPVTCHGKLVAPEGSSDASALPGWALE